MTISRPGGPPGVVRSRFRALGTYVELVLYGPAAQLGTAVRLLQAELADVDAACSRFRPDSELMQVNAAAGRTVQVSPLFAEYVAAALRAAEQTDGDVDPTLAGALVAAGYDSDFADLPVDGAPVVPRPPRPGAWQEVELDAAGTVRIPSGVALDLGATAKALAADHAAARIAAATGAGALVNLGGDIAVAGPPHPAGWPVRVTDRPVHDDDGASGQVIHLHGGGLATSSTVVRQWRRGGSPYHHILDPRTGLPAEPVWRTITVTAASCVDANTASTAAIVRGHAALAWLAGLRLPSRLLAAAGAVHHVAGWPAGAADPGRAARGGSPVARAVTGRAEPDAAAGRGARGGSAVAGAVTDRLPAPLGSRGETAGALRDGEAAGPGQAVGRAVGGGGRRRAAGAGSSAPAVTGAPGRSGGNGRRHQLASSVRSSGGGGDLAVTTVPEDGLP